MHFRDEIWERPAVGGDVGGIAIGAVTALRAVHTALQKLSVGSTVDLTEELETIEDVAGGLDKTFIELTGWTDEYES